MEKSDREAQRKDVRFKTNALRYFLKSIEDAYKKWDQDIEKFEQECAEPDLLKRFLLAPGLQIETRATDGMRFITESLRRAIEGENDPFQLKLPRGGVPKLSKLDEFDIAVDVCRLWKKEGKSKEEACAEIAEQYSFPNSKISTETVTNITGDLLKSYGDRLSDEDFCGSQRELIDLLETYDTHPSKTSF